MSPTSTLFLILRNGGDITLQSEVVDELNQLLQVAAFADFIALLGIPMHHGIPELPEPPVFRVEPDRPARAGSYAGQILIPRHEEVVPAVPDHDEGGFSIHGIHVLFEELLEHAPVVRVPVVRNVGLIQGGLDRLGYLVLLETIGHLSELIDEDIASDLVELVVERVQKVEHEP